MQIVSFVNASMDANYESRDFRNVFLPSYVSILFIAIMEGMDTLHHSNYLSFQSKHNVNLQ